MKKLIVAAAFCAAAFAASAVEPNPTWWRISRTMERMARSTAERPETVRILFYGQSIVQQPWNLQYLVPELKKRYPTVNFEVANRAIGGYQSPSLIKTAEADLYPFYPDLLFFHVYGPTDKYAEIVRRVRERTTADIVLWTSHLDRKEGETPEKIRALLERPDRRSLDIREIADRYGCMFIDMRAKWCRMLLEKGIVSGELLGDGIHMKPTTFPVYAQMIGEELFAGGTAAENAAAGEVRNVPAATKIEFDGNRVVAVANGEAGAEYDVFLDGRRAAEHPDMWTMTRASVGPSKKSWNPVLDRVRPGQTPVVVETWTLTFLPGGKDDGTAVPFSLAGSVTGEDGTGWSTNRFVSKSGRVVIDPDDWMSTFWWGYHKVKPEPGYKVTWQSRPMVVSPYRPGAKGERTVLVQNCANGHHVLELKPLKAGPLGIASFDVHRPRVRDGWTWLEKEALPVEGKGFRDVETFFCRMPLRSKGVVRGPIWDMSHDATGLYVRFKTDAKKLALRWKVKDERKQDPLIPPAGVLGVDVYRLDAKKGWTFAGNKRYEGSKNGKKTLGEAEFAWNPDEAGIIYLPYRSHVTDFKLGIPEGCRLTAFPHGDPAAKPVVHYGTSIVHGGCVSRPGLMFTSIAGRLLDRDYINLGFSGNGRMEKEMAPFLAEIDAGIYVVDCAWNMNEKMVDANAIPFLREMKRLKPDTPILLCEGCLQTRRPFGPNVAMRRAYDTLKKEDPGLWRNLHYFEAKDMLPVNDEVTHDFCHPNDYGSVFMGPAYARRISEVFVAEARARAKVAHAKEGETVRALDRDVYVHAPNYDKAKIPPYRLEDPLAFVDGRQVTKANWAERRKEILGIFAREMYGAEPPAPEKVVTELVDEKVAAAGYAIRRQYRMWFKADKSGPCVNWIVWIPRHAKKPVPVISFLNYRGNHELVPDDDVVVQRAWTRFGPHLSDVSVDHRASAETRGVLQDPSGATVFPLGTILARGYAVMSACYCEVSPDPEFAEPDPRFRQDAFAYTGVFGLWGARDAKRTDNVTAIGAWGWALSRGLDLAARIPEIDAKKSVVTGCSRLGKAALVAAARDERFAVCAPVQTGGGGVPLAKRDYGENVSTENRSFTHWYCTAYAKYAKDPHLTMPFDQHLFLACVAPRALLIEGFDNPWFDTEGEYLAAKAASPVWELLTGSGLPQVDCPADYDTSAIGPRLGYVRRSEEHGISACDWNWTMDFADKVFGK